MRARRAVIADRYTSAFTVLGDLVELPGVKEGTRSACISTVAVGRQGSKNAQQLAEDLNRLGIGTSVHFIPLHLSAHFRQCFGFRGASFLPRRRILAGIVSTHLPSYVRLRCRTRYLCDS